MPRSSWSAKRERQYEHIKSGLLKRGEDLDEAQAGGLDRAACRVAGGAVRRDHRDDGDGA